MEKSYHRQEQHFGMCRCVIDHLRDTRILSLRSAPRQNMDPCLGTNQSVHYCQRRPKLFQIICPLGGMQSVLQTIIALEKKKAWACYSKISPDTRSLGPVVQDDDQTTPSTENVFTLVVFL